MIYKAEFVHKARLELLEACEWYEDKQPGLGDRFLKEVFRIVSIIEQNHDRYPERRRYYREALIRVFPYILIYRVNNRKKTIAIVAVFHTRRNPKLKFRNS